MSFRANEPAFGSRVEEPAFLPRHSAFRLGRDGTLVLPASHLAHRPVPATVSTGIPALDELTGGISRGALTELCGPPSSGRTSVLLSVVARLTQAGEVCALVDATDSFDPRSAASAGVELKRVLWVRCSDSTGTHADTADGKFAIGNLQTKSGTRPNPENCKSQITNHKSPSVSPCLRVDGYSRRKSQLSRLEQALKATDLLLQGGGFALVAVDLANIVPESARRIPLTSWFRFRRAVENTPTALVVLEQQPYAKTCASLVVQLSATASQLCVHRPTKQPAHAALLGGLEIRAEVIRDRQPRKAACSVQAEWRSQPQFAM